MVIILILVMWHVNRVEQCPSSRYDHSGDAPVEADSKARSAGTQLATAPATLGMALVTCLPLKG